MRAPVLTSYNIHSTVGFLRENAIVARQQHTIECSKYLGRYNVLGNGQPVLHLSGTRVAAVGAEPGYQLRIKVCADAAEATESIVRKNKLAAQHVTTILVTRGPNEAMEGTCLLRAMFGQQQP